MGGDGGGHPVAGVCGRGKEEEWFGRVGKGAAAGGRHGGEVAAGGVGVGVRVGASATETKMAVGVEHHEDGDEISSDPDGGRRDDSKRACGFHFFFSREKRIRTLYA